MKNLLRVFPAFLLMGLLMACGGGSAETDAETPAATSPETETTAETADTAAVDALKAEVVANYADMVYASYQDSYETAVTLQTALQTFVANPTEDTHQA
ncbi:MAG: peptidase, partial [Anaerolineae bacterium]|nr:peptidase [Anaerolineae bacterium]